MQYYKIVHLWMKMLQNTTLTFPYLKGTEAQIYDLQILHICPHQNILTITTSTTYTSFSFSFQIILQWLRVLTIKCREERWMLDFPRKGEVVVSGERPCPECPEWNKWRKSDTCAQLPAFSVVLAGTKVSQKWLWCLIESRVRLWRGSDHHDGYCGRGKVRDPHNW